MVNAKTVNLTHIRTLNQGFVYQTLVILIKSKLLVVDAKIAKSSFIHLLLKRNVFKTPVIP